MSDSSEQCYLGSEGFFCPIFSDLKVKDPNIVGKTRSIHSVGLPADMLSNLEDIGKVAASSGAKLKQVFEV